MNKATKITLGILGAAAVGVVVAGLLYTEKGKEIRSQLGSKASDAKDDLTDWFNKGKSKVSEAASHLAKKANGYKKTAEDMV